MVAEMAFRACDDGVGIFCVGAEAGLTGGVEQKTVALSLLVSSLLNELAPVLHICDGSVNPSVMPLLTLLQPKVTQFVNRILPQAHSKRLMSNRFCIPVKYIFYFFLLRLILLSSSRSCFLEYVRK